MNFSELSLWKTYDEHLKIQDEIRISIQEWLYSYYSGDSTAIKGYLEIAIKKVLGDEVIKDNEWLYDFVNITKKMIDRMAVIYREPAERYIDGKEELTDYLYQILPEDMNSKDKKAQRFAKLFNTSLTQVYFNKNTGRIDFNLEPSHKYKVKTDYDDPYKITEISYEKYFLNKVGKEELFTVVWTEDEHYKMDADGKKYPVGENEDMKNPFKDEEDNGIIPFPFLMAEDGEDFWGIGQDDLVNVNEMVNFLLTFLLNDAIVLGTSGTLLAVNLELQKKGEEKNSLKKVRVGRRHPIVVEQARGDLAPPSLSYVSTDPLIVEIQNSIDYRIKQIAVLKGLNPNAILSEIKDTSDYQKMMDAAEMIEIRRDDIEPCRAYEKRRFEVIKAVNNAAAKDSELKSKFGLKEIPWDAELEIDFAEIEIQKSTDELWKDREEREKRNMGSALDWLMEENPDLDEEQAQKILNDNRVINSNQKPLTRLEQLTQLNRENVND